MRNLSELKSIADRSLNGLEVREDLWRDIQKKAEKPSFFQKKTVWIPAVALVAVFVVAFSLGGNKQMTRWNIGQMGTAGENSHTFPLSGKNVSVQISHDEQQNEEGLILLNGAVYVITGETASPELLGKSLGVVDEYTASPSLSTSSCASSVIGSGSELFQIKGANGLIAASSGDAYWVFQRTSRFGKIGISQLEASLCKPEQVQSITIGNQSLSGGESALAMKTLLNTAERINDTVRGFTAVTIKLKNGLTLSLSAGEDCIIGCGVWYCPDFFKAFSL